MQSTNLLKNAMRLQRMNKLTGVSPITAGFLFAIGSSALFAIRPIFVKLVYAQNIDPTTLIAFRMLFSAPIYVVILMLLLRDIEKRNKLTAKNVLGTCLVGAIGYYIASILDLFGLQYVTAQLGRMILYAFPTFVVLLGALFFGERITIRTIISLIITYTGVAIIFGHDLTEFGDDVITGSLFIITCAFSFSIYLTFSKSLISEIGSRVFTCIALISASFCIFLHYALTHSISTPEVTQTGLFWILVIAIFCTVIPTFFTTSAVARIGADRTGIVAMIGPGFTSVFAVLILAEEFTIYHLVGLIVTIFGVATLNKK